MARIISRVSRRNRPRSRATIINEALEPRRLFAAVAWDGGGDGSNWSDANNWSNNAVPTGVDDVTINVAATPTVVIGAGVNAFARSLDCSEAIDIRGSLDLFQASVVRAYARLQGTVSGAGNFQVHGYLELLGNARFTGAGRTTIGPTALMLIGTATNTTLTLERNLVLEGGQVDWVQGEVRLNNATIDNRGLWRCSDPASPANLTMRGVGGTNAFLNNIRTDVRAGTTTLTGVGLSNANNVNIAGNARLVLAAGGTHGGRFDLQASSSSLALDGAHNFNGSASVTGAGVLELLGGTTTRSGAMTLPRFTMRGGTLDCAGGDVTFAGNFEWHGGHLRGGSGAHLVVPATSGLFVLGATAHSLSGLLQIDADSSWTGGEIAMLGGTLVNNGFMVADATSSDLRVYASGGTSNGVFNHGTIYRDGNAARALRFEVPVTVGPAGRITIDEGTVTLGAGGSIGGTVVTDPGTTLSIGGNLAFDNVNAFQEVNGHLRFDAGTSSYPGILDAQQSITVAGGSFTASGMVEGVVNVSGGDAIFNNLTTITGGTMSGGTLRGSGNFVISGSYSWGTGTWAGTGTTTVTDQGALNLNGDSRRLARRLVNNGFVFWTAGEIALVGGAAAAHIENNGLFAARSAADLRFVQDGAAGTQFVNNGHVAKQLGGALIVPAPPPGPDGLDSINFANRGLVAVEGGRFEIRSPAAHTGQFHVDAGCELILSRWHSLSRTSVLTGQGTVRLQSAAVQVHGDQGFVSGRLIVQDQSTVAFRGMRTRIGAIAIEDGSLAELPINEEPALLVTENLTLGPQAVLELNDNPLIVDYAGASPFAAIAQAVKSGYNDGAWNGVGLRSLSAALTMGTMGLACVEARDIFTSFPATFAGQTIDGTAVLVRQQAYGDANLDGFVNLVDFNRLAASFGRTAVDWSRGDFTYDGAANLADFNRLAMNFGWQSAPSQRFGNGGSDDRASLGDGTQEMPLV